MNGQWLGDFAASGWAGSMILDIDELNVGYGARAYLFSNDARFPNAVAYLQTNGKTSPLQSNADILPIDPRTGDPAPWQQVAASYPPDISFASRAHATFRWAKRTMTLKWRSDIGTEGKATLTKSNADMPSEVEPIVMAWDEFKTYVNSLDYRRYIFRGQRQPWRLRTHFHRTGRADLTRYLAEDIPTLHRHLSARTRHLFDRRDNDENGAFFHLAQHHGYPTPLLDWSYSPFVAAFFAYRNVRNSEAAKAKKADRVRIFEFDKARWMGGFPQIPKLTPTRPHFSVLEFLAIENERMVPQQALSALTNVDDIESYIRNKETQTLKFLKVIDLPIGDRVRVMRELSVMGITAGSLFPGLDGACEELRERFFTS